MKHKDYKAMLELVLDNTHEGIVFCDVNGKILFFNRPYETIFNLNKDKDIGKNIKEIFPDARIPIVAKTGLPEYGVIYNWRGSKHIVNRIPIKHGSKLLGVVTQVLFRDIQELNELSENINILKAKLESMRLEFNKCFRAKYTLNDIVGEDHEIMQLKKLAAQYSRTTLPVLILGESGTGKELFAHALHQMSSRATRSFLIMNCAAIPKELMESELFGYERGAFTGANHRGKIGKFELVDGGTIFLDEIGDMPLEMQAKILRIIENKQVTRLGGVNPVNVDFRLIASTNRDIEKMVHEGSFRPDLFYRLNTFVLKIPPLRERQQDIPHIVTELAMTSECNVSKKSIQCSEEVIQSFIEYAWPGNIRELKNVVDFAINNLTEEEWLIKPHHLPLSLRNRLRNTVPFHSQDVLTFKEAKKKMEKEIIQEALVTSFGKKKAAAKLLGISRSVLYEKMKSYGL
jgi:transcriptional regulator with PAS, ATPase and Fis domain